MIIMSKKLFSVLISVILLIFLCGTTNVDQQVYVPASDVPALIDAIQHANSRSQAVSVKLGGGTYSLSPLVDGRIPFNYKGNNGLPPIRGNITINGQDSTITRDPSLTCKPDHQVTDGDFRIFYVHKEGFLTLDNLTVSRGCPDSKYGGGFMQGGSIMNKGKVVINRTALVDNSAVTGGGVENFGHLIIRDSNLSTNSAKWGGGIENHGETTLINTVVSGNKAKEGGGGIYNPQGTIEITRSTFTDNSARNGGVINNVDKLKVKDSVFTKNSAQDSGGSITNKGGGTVEITNSTFSKNSAHSGGAIANPDGQMEIAQSVISDNSADFAGGIWSDNSLKIKDSRITGNYAESYGGGIYSAGTLLISNCTFSNNLAKGSKFPHKGGGGGRFSGPAPQVIINSTFSHNSAAMGSGGGISVSGHMRILNSTFVGNSAGERGGGMFINASAQHTLLKIKNAIVAHNTSGDDCFIESCQGPENLCGVYRPQGVNLDTDGSCPGFSLSHPDPRLGSLADNGGFTKTHALQPGSPAIDAAIDCTDFEGEQIKEDQRGVNRPQGPKCDIGSFEKEKGEIARVNEVKCAKTEEYSEYQRCWGWHHTHTYRASKMTFLSKAKQITRIVTLTTAGPSELKKMVEDFYLEVSYDGGNTWKKLCDKFKSFAGTGKKVKYICLMEPPIETDGLTHIRIRSEEHYVDYSKLKIWWIPK